MARGEKLQRAFERLESSSQKLKEATQEKFSEGFSREILVEVVCKRFEYTYESLWKLLKELLLKEGIESQTPLECCKEAFRVGWIDKKFEGVYPLMVKKRNEIVHVYSDEDAYEIYLLIKSDFTPAILDTLEKVRAKMKS